MSAKLMLLVACALFAAVSAAHVRRDAPKPAEVPSFAEFFETAGKNLKEMETVFLKALGVENTEQLEKKALDQGKELAAQFDQWAINIKKETEGLKDNAAVKEIRASADKVLDDIKAQHPQTTAEVKSLVEKFTKSSEEVMGKLKTVYESDETKHVKELSQKLMDSASATFQNIIKDIEKTVKN